MRASPAPRGFGVKAKRIWDQITKDYELRPDDMRVLEDACREVDLVERMETALLTEPLMVKGSMGQLVAHPLVQELRQHRATSARLFAQLKLTDGGESPADGKRSASARDAATQRWRAS